jgi:hypothetical protein
VDAGVPPEPQGEVRYRVSVGFGKAVTYRPIIKDLLEYALQTPAKVFKQIERGVANNLSATAALGL